MGHATLGGALTERVPWDTMRGAAPGQRGGASVDEGDGARAGRDRGRRAGKGRGRVPDV